MPTNDTATRATKQRWAIPLLAVAIGLAYLLAGWIGDDLGFGVFGLILMVTIAALFAILRRYSETVAGLLDRRDERINRIDTEATLVAGMAVIVAVIAGFIIEIARGEDGSPYSGLGAIAGISYVAALVFLRFRR